MIVMQRRALILGASSQGGLGEATARRLAADGYGVILAGRRIEPLEKLAAELGGTAVVCDVTDEASVEAMMKGAGVLNVAVNAAGTTDSFSIARSTKERIEAQLAVHVLGNFAFLKHALSAMPEGGNIVLFSSLTAKLPGVGISAYAAAKAGLDHLVRIAALEFGGRNIRVNAVAPGFSRTPMTEAFLSDSYFNELYAGESPLNALVSPEEVAAAVAWLASPECFMTGEIMQVSGGAPLGRLPNAKQLNRK